MKVKLKKSKEEQEKYNNVNKEEQINQIDQPPQNYYQRKNNPKSEFEYYDIMYKICETLMQIITLNFGFDKKENKVEICADFTAMTKRDQATLLWLGEKYGIKIINTPYSVLEFFKVWMLDTYKNISNNIIAANSIYPNNEYELNLKKKHITEAMNLCEVLIQIVQMSKQLFKCDENKLMYFVDLIIKERNRLKNWKSSCSAKYNEQVRKGIVNDFIKIYPNSEQFINKLSFKDLNRYIGVANSNKLKCPIKINGNSAGNLSKNANN